MKIKIKLGWLEKFRPKKETKKGKSKLPRGIEEYEPSRFDMFNHIPKIIGGLLLIAVGVFVFSTVEKTLTTPINVSGNMTSVSNILGSNGSTFFLITIVISMIITGWMVLRRSILGSLGEI